MASKLKHKNIFESSFDSFEFDDGFLMKIDSELKKNKINEKQSSLFNKCKPGENQEIVKNKSSDIKDNYYDLPLFIEDLDESDFFDFSKNHKKKNSLKVVTSHKDKNDNKGSVNNFATCPSPILGPKVSKKLNLSSSTPLKPTQNSLSKEKPSSLKKLEKNPTSNSEFDYLEADLFDDWDVIETEKKDSPKDTVTFSQALKLIEEAESARTSDQEVFNLSLDLLTGEVVGTKMKNMFEESFGLPESVEKKCEKKSLNNSLMIIDECKVDSKPAAAQKLNFGSEKLNSSLKLNNFCNEFDSDDDFDFLTQELLKKPRIISKYKKPNMKSPNISKTKKKTPLKNHDLNDSNDDVIILKKNRKKCFNIIESDGTEDSPSPKFMRQQNSTKKQKDKNFGKEFIDSEAEVSDEVKVSSDEAEEEGEYDKSFLDEESYFSQNNSANMTAKYLESVKTAKRHGGFKIPAPKPYIPDNIFSQIPEESSTDYEIFQMMPTVEEVGETSRRRRTTTRHTSPEMKKEDMTNNGYESFTSRFILCSQRRGRRNKNRSIRFRSCRKNSRNGSEKKKEKADSEI